MSAESSPGAVGGASRPDFGEFSDDFDASALDTGVWVPHYLPMWSSRAESAATYAVAGSELRLTIPPDQRLWCPGDHDPLRSRACSPECSQARSEA
jgi:hypothetical protein